MSALLNAIVRGCKRRSFAAMAKGEDVTRAQTSINNKYFRVTTCRVIDENETRPDVLRAASHEIKHLRDAHHKELVNHGEEHRDRR
jgi:hypothetical protein